MLALVSHPHSGLKWRVMNDKSTKDSRVETLSELPVEVTYESGSAPSPRPRAGLYPFTRGVHETMYRGKPWTMRQYAGFGTASEANERYHFLLKQGTTGLSVAFDLPTQMGRDSDHPLAAGEVGKVGVAISTVEDMERLLAGIPLESVSISMTINATAAILLGFLLVVAERRGVPWDKLNGTIQNDILKEYIARGTYIYPPRPALRIVTDIFSFCSRNVPKWNTINVSGYHIREAGSTAVEEVAFTLADGIAYVEAAIAAGLPVDQFAPRVAFFFNCQIDFLEEVSKFRAARTLWAEIMRDRFGAKDPKSMMLRFHTQTAGSSLTAQQPLNNVVRTTIEAMAAVFGGTQSLHTNSYDEALCLPSPESVTLALRTQQIIAHESGIASSVDPFGGSYLVESWTDRIISEARERIALIDRMGGMLAAIEQGYPQGEIERSAYRFQQRVESGSLTVVGVNRYKVQEDAEVEIQRMDPKGEAEQCERLRTVRASRDRSAFESAMSALRSGVGCGDNLMGLIVGAIRAGATLGEISDLLRGEFGEYHP